MNFYKVFKVVEDEFDSIIASMVVAALTVNLTTKPKRKDIEIPGSFKLRIDKKTRGLLWEHHPEDIELAIKIRDVWHDFESGQIFQGLGGCKSKTLKELIAIK